MVISKIEGMRCTFWGREVRWFNAWANRKRIETRPKRFEISINNSKSDFAKWTVRWHFPIFLSYVLM